ncbi:MAG: hypothetical protein KatS3mg015_2413 [Fimbriimonadales bacterium]|nr:MAG: hypothetical protein KatS3mg015_2413 [Fimbriimonadales bacterium]
MNPTTHTPAPLPNDQAARAVSHGQRGPTAHDLAALRAHLAELAARQARIEDLLVRLSAGKHLELLTTEDVRRILGIGRTKLNELIASGELPMWKLGGERRITRAGLEAYIRAQARGGR